MIRRFTVPAKSEPNGVTYLGRPWFIPPLGKAEQQAAPKECKGEGCWQLAANSRTYY